MIYKIRMHLLRMGELLQFFYDVIKLCNQQSTPPMNLSSSINALTTDTDSYSQYYKLDLGSEITRELVDLDFRRDECVSGIHMLIEGYSRYFTPTLKMAAQSLLISMDKYGKAIYDLNYQAETTTIKSILNEWSANPSLASAVTALNLGAWISELQTVNNLFNDRYLKRVEEKALAPQVKSFEVRRKAVTSYRKLVQQIEARAVLDQEQTFTGLINNLNALIVKYNVIADSHVHESNDENDN